MKIYHLAIGGVDSETEWSMRSTNKEKLKEFLAKYDHEGSNVSLHVEEEILPSGGGYETTLYSEAVYKELE